MLNHKILSLVLAFLFLGSIVQTYDDFECNHDDEEFEPGFIDINELNNEDEDRDLGSSGYPKIRIATNFDYLTGGSSSFKSYVKNDLIPPVISYFQNALHIKNPAKSNIKVAVGDDKVCEYKPPSILTTSGVSADHFVFFTTGAESNNYLATSMFCQLSTDLKRPIISRVKFNLNYLQVPNGDHLIHEKNTYLLMHEMTHSFGFSLKLYKYFVDGNLKVMTNHIKKVNLHGSTRTVLDVPCITNRVRKHFGCSSLPGVYMENNGNAELTAGSHLERKHFLLDMMTSGSLNGARVTEMSLAVLEASGWYVPDYNYAEPNHFGAGQGCGFVNNKCGSSSPFDEFCTTSQERGCFSSGRGGGFCKPDNNADGCKFHNPTVNFDCENHDAKKQTRLSELQEFGSNSESKCFEGTLSTQENDRQMSFCFRYDCAGSGSSTSLEVQIGNHKVVCKKPGKVSVPGYEGAINCPDPLTFCQTVGKPYCQRNCMGRGKCSNGKCICNSGFKGKDCSERV